MVRVLLFLLSSAVLLCVGVCKPVGIHANNFAPALERIAKSVQEKSVVLQERAVRRLQLSSGRNTQEVINQETFLEDCTEEIVAYSLSNSSENLENYLSCVQDSIDDIAGRCFGNWPGVWDPLRCLLVSNIDSSGDGSSEGSDSANADAEQITTEISSIAGNTNKPTREECGAFGSSNPSIIACISLTDSTDFDGFNDAYANNFAAFADTSCKELLTNFNFDEADQAQEGSEGIGDSDAELIDPLILSLREKVTECDSEYDLGIQSTLDEYKGPGSASPAPVSMSAVAMLLIIVNLLGLL